MQRYLAGRHDRFPNMAGQGGVVGPDQFDQIGFLVHKVGAPRQIDSRLHEALVQGHQRISVPAQTRTVTKSLVERLAEG